MVLLHRARRLALAEPEARVVLTTFTTNLAEQMRTDLGTLDARVRLADRFGERGVQVIGIDALASAVLQSASVGELDTATATLFGQSGRDVARRTDETELWQRALAAAGSALPAELASVPTIKGEYAAVILPRRISRKEDYVRVPRPGRGVRLSRAQRLAVWAVVEAYRAHAYAEGGVDYAEAAALAALVLEQRPRKPADHALVDEGQDLGPCHLQLIRSLVVERGNDVFLAEDSHQRIYGQRIVLSHYGLNIRGRSSRLRLNYRTTAENLTLARGILEGATWVDGEDQPEDSSGYRSLRNGPRPRFVACETLTAEYDRAADLIKSWLDELDTDKLKLETLAVLVRDRRQRDQVVAALGERGVRVRAVDRGKVPAGLPVVMTMHRSKGTEFAKVLLLGVSSKNLPARFVVQSHGPQEERDEAMLRERALLYVAASRGRDELVISFSGTQSPLLPGGSLRDTA